MSIVKLSELYMSIKTFIFFLYVAYNAQNSTKTLLQFNSELCQFYIFGEILVFNLL